MTRPSMQSLFDRLPHHNIEAEMSLLGSMILDPKFAVDIVIPRVPGPDVFYSEAHSEIYSTILSAYDRRNGNLDLVLLQDELRRKGLEEVAGGIDYSVSLAEGTPSAASVEHYTDIVMEKYRLRTAIDAIGEAAWELTKPDADCENSLASVLDKLSKVASEDSVSKVYSSDAVAADIRDRIMRGEPEDTIPTGFRTIDEWFRGGLRRRHLIGVGGRPSEGKSIMGGQIALQASEVGRKPAFVSLEMTPEELTQRWMAFYGCPMNATERDQGKIDLAYEMMESHKIPILDLPGAQLGDIRAHARTLKRKRGVDLLIVDYLQLIRMPEAPREYDRITEASAGLKAIAREYDIAVVMLFQLNRDAGRRERPGMDGGKGSGSIEQDCDEMILIHNPPDCEHPELIVAKQRNGRTGTVSVECRKAESRFVDRGEATYTPSRSRFDDDSIPM